MELLEALRMCNDVPILSVWDEAFKSFGRVLKGYDVHELTTYMEESTEIPAEGNVYVASVGEMEDFSVAEEIRACVYGGMPIQIGYCNGRNSTYNGFEYHKGSEINVAVTDFMLVLGHTYDIANNTYDIARATVFFVPKGSVIEMYQTTLHLSPLRVREDGFKDIVILPRGTNTPLREEEIAVREEKRKQVVEVKRDDEAVLLLQRNKWVIAHPDREPLIRQGAYPGVTGENKELFYPVQENEG